MKRASRYCCFILLFAAQVAEARVFSFQGQRLAAYLRGSGGLSALGQDAFKHASGSGTAFDDTQSQYNFSGEFGVQISAGSVNLRLGIEALRPKDVEIVGKNAAGTLDLINLTSEVFAYSPNLSLEFIYSSIGNVRFYGLLGAGYVLATLDNHFAFTSDGNTAFNPLTSYKEKADGSAISYIAGLGFETLFVDNCTFSLDFVYRYLVIDNFEHKAPVTTLAQGAVVKGAPVRNADGSKRRLDLSGVTIGASFRFYLNF